MRKRIVCLAMMLALCSSALADHGDKRETTLNDGGLVTSTSWKSNYIVYKSVGGETVVKGKEMKRQWWCVWLCKRRVDKNAERIEIVNTYFSEVQPGVFARLERAQVCTNKASCKQSEWAIGVGVKMQFPNGSTPTPAPLDGLLPVDGVITRHTVIVDGGTIVAVTSAGKHPPNIIL
jgi:hypothetical protein